MKAHIPTDHAGESGFTLIEVLISSLILTVGLVAVAYCFGLGFSVVLTSQEDTIARQKAREMVESVFTGRDTSNLTYDQICNVGAAPTCIFVNGLTPLTTAPTSGILNNIGDIGPVEQVWTPGADGILGTSDDVQVVLGAYQRQIEIVSLTPSLKQITVTIQYLTTTGVIRKITINALMSPYA